MNVTVQLLKHPPPPVKPLLIALDPLSGHVGVVGATGLAWLVVGPVRHRVAAATAVLLALAVVAAGVILASWHSVPQVFCPLAICLGWTLVLAGVDRRSTELSVVPEDRKASRAGTRTAVGGGALLGGCASVLIAAVLVGMPRAALPNAGEAVALAVTAVVGSCTATVGIVMLLTTPSAHRRPVQVLRKVE